jgi:GNAT superfamily N-acetyltransferase
MTELSFKTIFNPSPTHIGFVEQGFQNFITAITGSDEPYEQKLVIMAEGNGAEIIGGIYGDLSWDWLSIHIFWVHADHQGKRIGSKLLSLMEQTAISKNIYHSHLETTDFMALDFYLKHGYEIFAELDGKPTGGKWYYLKKNLLPE